MPYFLLVTLIAMSVTSIWSPACASGEEEAPLPAAYQKVKPRKRAIFSFHLSGAAPQPLISSARYIQIYSLEALEAEFQELNASIRNILKAEENIPFKESLRLKQMQANLNLEQQTVLDNLLPRLLPPEELIGSDPTERERLIAQTTLEETHECLRPLTKLLEDLRMIHSGPLFISEHRSFLTLITYYEEFLRAFCQGSPEERRKKLLLRTKVSGERLGHYLISQEDARRILSKDIYGASRRHLNTQEGGQSAVYNTGGVHFKAASTSLSDINPAMEGAMHCFAHLLFGQGTTPSTVLSLQDVLLRFNPVTYCAADDKDEEAKKARLAFMKQVIAKDATLSAPEFFAGYPQYKSYFVNEAKSTGLIQASRTAGELSLFTFFEKVKNGELSLRDLDPASYSALVLTSLITVPSDAKDDNIRVTFKNGLWKLISIDNDRALADMIVQSSSGKHVIQGKNILYLLEEPMAWQVDKDIRQPFLNLDGLSLILDWLHTLEQQNNHYQSLSKVHKIEHTAADPYFPLLLKPHTAMILLKRIQVLQQHLIQPTISHEVLLKQLFPAAHYGYQRLRKAYSQDPHQAQEALYNQFYLEDFLAEEEGETAASLQEALALETAFAGAYEQERTHSIAQEVEAILDSLDLHALSSAQRLQLLSRVVEHWPDKRGRLWQGSEIVYKIVQDLTAENSSQSLSSTAASILAYALSFPDVDINYQYYEAGKSSDKNKETLLHLLATCEHPELEALLDLVLQKGAKVQLQNSRGLTALDKALLTGQETAILKLLAYQADLYIQPSSLLDLITTYASSPKFAEPLEEIFKRNPQGAWLKTLTTLLPLSLQSAGEGFEVELLLNKNGRLQIDRRFLSPDFAKTLFPQGKFKEVYHTKNHSIGLLEHKAGDVFLKWRPTFSGIEAAVQTLTQRIFPEVVFPTTLAKIKGEPCLLSQARGRELGEGGFEKAYRANTLYSVLKDAPHKLKKLDPYFFSQSIIMAMLLNPEDGKPSNYILEPSPRNPELYRIMGIDNDQAFAPELTKPSEDPQSKPVIRLKSILFCLDQMQESIHPEVVQRILELEPYALLEDWLQELQQIHSQHLHLFSSHEKLAQANCFLGVPFQEGEARNLAHKLIAIQFLLKENPTIKLVDLFKKVCPFSAHHYGKALKRYRNSPILERFDLLDGDSYKKEVKDSQDVHTTLTSGQDLLKARNIPTGKDRQKVIQEGKTHDPAMMLKELHEDQKAYNQQALASLILQQQTNNRMAYQILKKKNLEKIDLDVEGYTLAQQQQIIQLMRDLKLKELSWRNAIIFDPWLSPPLSLKLLESLNLQGCRFLKPEFLITLAKEAQRLKYLNLSQIPALDKIKGPRLLTFTRSSPLIFPEMTALFFNGCINLEEIYLQAPKLEVLGAADCPQLKNLKITAPNLQQADFQNDWGLQVSDIKPLDHQAPHLTIRLPTSENYIKFSNFDKAIRIGVIGANEVPYYAQLVETLYGLGNKINSKASFAETEVFHQDQYFIFMDLPTKPSKRASIQKIIPLRTLFFCFDASPKEDSLHFSLLKDYLDFLGKNNYPFKEKNIVLLGVGNGNLGNLAEIRALRHKFYIKNFILLSKCDSPDEKTYLKEKTYTSILEQEKKLKEIDDKYCRIRTDIYPQDLKGKNWADVKVVMINLQDFKSYPLISKSSDETASMQSAKIHPSIREALYGDTNDTSDKYEFSIYEEVNAILCMGHKFRFHMETEGNQGKWQLDERYIYRGCSAVILTFNSDAPLPSLERLRNCFGEIERYYSDRVRKILLGIGNGQISNLIEIEEFVGCYSIEDFIYLTECNAPQDLKYLRNKIYTLLIDSPRFY